MGMENLKKHPVEGIGKVRGVHKGLNVSDENVSFGRGSYHTQYFMIKNYNWIPDVPDIT